MSEHDAACMLLGISDREKSEHLRRSLRPGLACVKDPRYGTAFTIGVPEVPVEKSIRAELIEERLRQFGDVLKVEPRVPASEVRKRRTEAQRASDGRFGKAAGRGQAGSAKAVEIRSEPVETGVKEFLWDIHANEDDGVAARYERLGLSGSAGDRLREKLEREGLVVVHRMNLAGRGGQTVLLEMTDKGYQVLGIDRPSERGIADFKHRFLQRLIAQRVEVYGWRAGIEGQLKNGKLVDVLGTDSSGGILGIEVEMRPDPHVVDNILRDFQGGVAKLYVVAPDMKVMKAITRNLKSNAEVAEYMDRVEVTVISRFLNREFA